MLVPVAGIGAVLLTNSDDGQAMLRPFMRRLLELLYDGKPEAAGDVAAAATRIKAEVAKEAELVSKVPDKVTVAALASSYYSPDLGAINVTRASSGTQFAFRTMATPVGTKKNEDGTISFVALDPTLLFFSTGCRQSGKRTLTARDGQHDMSLWSGRRPGWSFSKDFTQASPDRVLGSARLIAHVRFPPIPAASQSSFDPLRTFGGRHFP